MSEHTHLLHQRGQSGTGLILGLLQPISSELEGKIGRCEEVDTGDDGLGELGITLRESCYQCQQQAVQCAQFGGDRISRVSETVELMIEIVDPLLDIGHLTFDGTEVGVERRNITHRNSPRMVFRNFPILAEMRPGVADYPAPGRASFRGELA